MKKNVLFLVMVMSLIIFCVGCSEEDIKDADYEYLMEQSAEAEASLSEALGYTLQENETEAIEYETLPQDTFVSDWIEGEKNIVGSTSWNMQLGGYVTEQGNWTYYIDNDNAQICKEDRSGNKTILMSQINARNINIIGDWVYFYAYHFGGPDNHRICRMRTDGSQFVSLETPGIPLNSFYITSENIIFAEKKQISASVFEYAIYTCDLNFENIQEIKKFDTEISVTCLGTYADKIYLYVSKDLCAISMGDLSFELVISDYEYKFSNSFILENNLISADMVDNKKIYKLNLDSLESGLWMDFPIKVNSVSYNNGEFILGTEGGIWSGSAEQLLEGYGYQVCKDNNAMVMAATVKYIYYKYNNMVYRIDYNSNNWKELWKFLW